MPGLAQDRLIRKEVALGLIREFDLPQDHIGLRLFAPFQDVASDDVIFQYMMGLSAGLAPARAEDSESELAQKDDSIGEGRASIIDWALKDHYDPSDISRFQESVYIAGQVGANLPLTFTDGYRRDFEARVARDTRLRRRKLDNRLEWLIMTALATGQIVYNDGKIKFTVDYQRPSINNAGNLPDGNPATPWSNSGSDPIGDIMAIQDYMLDTFGVTIGRALVSRRIIRNIIKSSKFVNDLIGSNPLYTVANWSRERARQVVQDQTGVDFMVYDSVYYTRNIGSTTRTANRFFPDDKILFLPTNESVAAIDDAIGFGKTLTSPHPEGNWTSGYYEWEKDTGPDPWGHDFGNGIKAFPVFPHMEMTYLLDVL